MFRKERTTKSQIEGLLRILQIDSGILFGVDYGPMTSVYVRYPEGGRSSSIAYGTKSEVYWQLKCARDVLYNMKAIGVIK